MIRTDSRKVKPGDTFVALTGVSSNGNEYINKAIENGAVRVVCDSGQYDVETIHASDTRKYLEEMLVREYGNIVNNMTLIAVTGTNGKTTTCYLLSQALNRLGKKCGYIGTIGFYLNKKVRSLPNTSVDICDLYELLLEAHEKGYDTIALEASSQGIALGRLNTISFDVAAFTNLTEDHLDYHKTMENYAMAKQTIFKRLKPGGTAVVNAEDSYKDYFLLEENNNFTFGMHSGDICVGEYEFADGTDFNYYADGKTFKAHSGIIGTYNIYNICTVISILRILGYDYETINETLPYLEAPSGRCEVVRSGDNNIVIDYAHTPDAIENIIASARGFTDNNIYVVFGCTGDREKEKRPVMTQLVLGNCKKAIITDDDPHSEDEQAIVRDMLENNRLSNYEVCLDRKDAIYKGIGMLEHGDTLLILGKGHEDYIVMKDRKIPHNDKKVVLEYISR